MTRKKATSQGGSIRSQYTTGTEELLWYACENVLPTRRLLMTCPHCTSTTTCKQTVRTQLATEPSPVTPVSTHSTTYRNALQPPTFPNDTVLHIGLSRVCHTLSLRDLAELLLERGVVFTRCLLAHSQAGYITAGRTYPPISALK